MKSTASLDTLSSNSPKPDKPVKRLPSWSIPVAILLGFALVFLVLFGDRILPAPKVDVAIVLAAPAAEQVATKEKPATTNSAEGSPLFQASGWIEPAPLPIRATALIDGVVETVQILHGQMVKKGDLLATLISEDARLALAITEQKHRMAQSTYTAQQSAIEAANKKVAGLEAQLAAAATLRDEAADRLKRIDQLPQSIVNAKTTAKPGEEISITGRIMGSSSPFVEGRAAFILADPAVLSACNDTPGDECETPWDCCCDSKEDKKRGTVTVQITGADGRVIKEPLENVGGIKKLATLTVTGKVAEGSTADLLILNATAIQAAE